MFIIYHGQISHQNCRQFLHNFVWFLKIFSKILLTFKQVFQNSALPLQKSRCAPEPCNWAHKWFQNICKITHWTIMVVQHWSQNIIFLKRFLVKNWYRPPAAKKIYFSCKVVIWLFCSLSNLLLKLSNVLIWILNFAHFDRISFFN